MRLMRSFSELLIEAIAAFYAITDTADAAALAAGYARHLFAIECRA